MEALKPAAGAVLASRTRVLAAGALLLGLAVAGAYFFAARDEPKMILAVEEPVVAPAAASAPAVETLAPLPTEVELVIDLSTAPLAALSPKPAAQAAGPLNGEHESAGTAAEGSETIEEPVDETPSPEAVAEAPPPEDPVVLAVRAQLDDAALRKQNSAADVAALAAFYAEHDGPPLWITTVGFSRNAQALIHEIEKADDWGLSAGAFDLPSAAHLPPTPEAQAAGDIKLSLAILKYARFARGGRLTPSRVSPLFDQKPALRDPDKVLSEIAASNEPVSYLQDLHPNHDQFGRLRMALAKARADAEKRGRKAGTKPEVQRLIVNMERWRWMPANLGTYYVWNNVPEYNTRVIKGGKTIYAERTIVGQAKYATPIFSAPMRSIVFHPPWVVPETILREDLQPALQRGGFFGGPSTAILRQHGLRVSYQGQPVDADTIDWTRVNVRQYTFTQPPGPTNVLGTLKFNFPNKHAVYMHDTPQRELFSETVRTLSHGCIRVREPDRLAALLLAHDKSWPASKVNGLLAANSNTAVKLNRPVPVHLTYFTAVADLSGKAETFTDVYGLDSKMAAALFGKEARLQAPPAAPEVTAQATQQRRVSRRPVSGGGFADAISGLFGN